MIFNEHCIVRCVCKIMKSDYHCLHVCVCVCVWCVYVWVGVCVCGCVCCVSLSVCLLSLLLLSVCTQQLGSHWTEFKEIWYLNIFWKSVKSFRVSLKSDTANGTSRDDHNTFMILSRSVLLRMRNVSDKTFRDNPYAHFTFNNAFWKPLNLWGNLEKYSRAGQAADNNMVHVHCILEI